MVESEITCPVCGSEDLAFFPERGEVVCRKCGTVVKEHIVDLGVEYRIFSPEQRLRKSRVGSPISNRIHDKGMTTFIDWSNKDYSGKRLQYSGVLRARKLRELQKKMRISSNMERKLVQILTALHRTSSKLSLPPHVIETAAIILKKAVKKGIIRGRTYDVYIGAALYMACRLQRVPRTLDDIVRAFGRQDRENFRKELASQYRKLLEHVVESRPPPTTPMAYIPRLIAKLNLSGKVQYLSAQILEKAVERGLSSGRGPMGLAAASVYVASVILDEKKTQKDVADAANVTEVTVRNRYKDIVENFDIIVTL